MASAQDPGRRSKYRVGGEGFREEWDRRAFARAVAIKVIEYRADHGLSQRQLADQLGLAQPQIARLETGEYDPSYGTLARLAGSLDLEVTISVVRRSRRPTALTQRGQNAIVAEYETDQATVRYAIGQR